MRRNLKRPLQRLSAIWKLSGMRKESLNVICRQWQKSSTAKTTRWKYCKISNTNIHKFPKRHPRFKKLSIPSQPEKTVYKKSRNLSKISSRQTRHSFASSLRKGSPIWEFLLFIVFNAFFIGNNQLSQWDPRASKWSTCIQVNSTRGKWRKIIPNLPTLPWISYINSNQPNWIHFSLMWR